ncbi:MAG TPA: BTAD domain-containing putative transcriptional regulator [Anaerolineales bacterium]|nr:BTAD domain-containing putative transcriptional regulator [Anaerolineales bacterium]
MTSQLALHFLGPPQLYWNEEPVSAGRRKAVALLAYLAVDGGMQTRDSLSALLWPDYTQSKAFTNLRHTLWEIQQAIGDGWIEADRETIGLHAEADISVDVHQFETLLTQGCSQDDASRRIPLLADSVKLYRNNFLTGFSLKDAPGFNEWAFAKSEELRRQLAEALTSLSEDHGGLGQAEQAIPYARRLVALDPLNESAHRLLMQVYIQAGQHSAALKQYQTCEKILRKELNLNPQPETRALYNKIRKGDVKPVLIEKPAEAKAPQHNLPYQISSLIGREIERDEIRNLVLRNRLVTLVGAGGIGKTKLALHVGQTVLNDYPDGVWWIALDSLFDPALVPQTVASVFDIRETSHNSLIERLIESLRLKTSLLIFDNCEHLLDASANLIHTLLTNCPNLKVLATSRETLGVAGEATYALPSLSVPEQEETSLENSSEYESVQLFAERAALAISSFKLAKENIRTVVEICRKVDGLPLAIELAAARVNILQVEEILKQLHDSFALLAIDHRTVSPRHQTVRASLDWSWRLLSEAEQLFLQQLSVFAGGWTLESAWAICDGDVLELTGALVKKSLIVVNQDSGRETRYRFHEIVREYALEKLVESGNQDKIRTRHLNYYVNFSEQAELALRGPARVEWLDRLNAERNNIRAALHWAEETNVEAGLCITGWLRRYWEISDLREGTRWLETFLQKKESNDVPLARATALLTYGWLLTWLQQFSKAHAITEESLALFRTAGNPQGIADAMISLANILQFMDDWDSGNELLHQALTLVQSLGDSWREANVYYFLGWDRRDAERGLAYWEKALRLYRKSGDQIALANLLGVSGQHRAQYGDIELGEKYIDEAMSLWQFNRRANIWENTRIAKSIIALIRGDHEQAYKLLEEALLAVKDTGNKMSYLWVRVRMGHVALRAGRLDEAHEILAETACDFHKDDYKIGVVVALEGMASLYSMVDKPDRAGRLIGFADAERKKIKDTRPNIEQADVDKIISACLAKMGEVGFSDSYDEGQAMSMDEAVNYALA